MLLILKVFIDFEVSYEKVDCVHSCFESWLIIVFLFELVFLINLDEQMASIINLDFVLKSHFVRFKNPGAFLSLAFVSLLGEVLNQRVFYVKAFKDKDFFFTKPEYSNGVIPAVVESEI